MALVIQRGWRRRKEEVYWLMKLQYVGLVRFLFTFGIIRADRLADNYSMLLSHFTRQNGVDPADIRGVLGIGEEYEDIC